MPYLTGEPVGRANSEPAANPIPKASVILRGAGIPSALWGADAVIFRGVPFGHNYDDILFLLVPDPEKAAEVLVRTGYSRAKAHWAFDGIREYQIVLAAPPPGADEPADAEGEASRPLTLLSADRFCYSLPARPHPGDDVFPPYDKFITSLFDTYFKTTEVEDIRLRDQLSLLILQVYAHLEHLEVLETLDLELKLPTRFHRLHRDIVTKAEHEDFDMGDFGSWRVTQYYVRMMEEDAKLCSLANGEAALS